LRKVRTILRLPKGRVGRIMKTYKVTYGNTITGNQNTITTKAASLEAAIATEEGMVARLSKFRPGMVLVSVVKA
jgi:hypothetical protein